MTYLADIAPPPPNGPTTSLVLLAVIGLLLGLGTLLVVRMRASRRVRATVDEPVTPPAAPASG